MSESLSATEPKIESHDDSKPRKSTTKLSAKAVAQYLQTSPKFFEQYPEVLGNLYLPDLHNSQSIGSLNIKQLGVLRERTAQSEQRLTDFLSNARDNQQLILQSKSFVLKLLDCNTSAEITATIKQLFDEDFGVQYTEVIGNTHGTADTLRVALSLTKACSDNTQSFQGAIRPEESIALFGHENAASAVVISHTPSSGEKNSTSLTIAIGNADGNFYTSDIGTEIIEFLVEVAAKLIARLAD